MSSGCNTTLLSDRNSVQKMAELVKNEKYSYAKQASALFSPLQLLNQIYSGNLKYNMGKSKKLDFQSLTPGKVHL